MGVRNMVILRTCASLCREAKMNVKIPVMQKLLDVTVKITIYGVLLGGFLGLCMAVALGEESFRTIMGSSHIGGILGVLLGSMWLAPMFQVSMGSTAMHELVGPMFGGALGELAYPTVIEYGCTEGLIGPVLDYGCANGLFGPLLDYGCAGGIIVPVLVSTIMGGVIGATLGTVPIKGITGPILGYSFLGGILGALLGCCCIEGMLGPILGCSWIGGLLGALLGYNMESKAIKTRLYNPCASLVIECDLNKMQKEQLLYYVRDYFKDMELEGEWDAVSLLSKYANKKKAIIRGIVTFFSNVMQYEVYFTKEKNTRKNKK